jgi:hypothetical protein
MQALLSKAAGYSATVALGVATSMGIEPGDEPMTCNELAAFSDEAGVQPASWFPPLLGEVLA